MNYVKAVRLRWDIMVAAAMIAFVSSFAGAVTVRYVPSTYLRSALAAIAVYTFWRKDLGGQAVLRYSGRKELLLAVVVGAVIGFYDGFLSLAQVVFLFLFLSVCLVMISYRLQLLLGCHYCSE